MSQSKEESQPRAMPGGLATAEHPRPRVEMISEFVYLRHIRRRDGNGWVTVTRANRLTEDMFHALARQGR